ncbi:uncharacterized protein LOC124156594 [Ischnura elegans]|uniref:uncharacterized protein LOC124156594 n=1 Tax=Ischnura elegans TaxID=197161 RepID=UPI001ED8706B|nr:uncharacterized protein LOC124156594 [Ischnura elegans]
MASVNIIEKLRSAVKANGKEEVKEILMSDHGTSLDLAVFAPSGKGSIINDAIEETDVAMLALLLGIQYPSDECASLISDSKRYLLTSRCDSEGLTPLLKAVKLGKLEMVSLLLSCGAEVNDLLANGRTAVDLSSDPKVVRVLFDNDSKFPRGESKVKDLQSLISADGDLRALFHERDEVHGSTKGEGLSPDLKKAFERGKWVYYVNSEGHSLLYTALANGNFDAWAYLLDQDMEYVSSDEKEKEKLNEVMCECALRNLLVPMEGCHVMKLMSKATVRGSTSYGKDLLALAFDYFKYLDENEITRTLMQVLQDVPGLQIAFDFGSASINRIQASCYEGDHGASDFDRCKISIAALANELTGMAEIASNMAHEMCHFAMTLVFKNRGLPYASDDAKSKEKYDGVIEEVRHLTNCDEIIRKVWNYDRSHHGMELIVRVPEMIVKYGRSPQDGFFLLEEQARSLLDFYLEDVQPVFMEYMDGIITSDRIIGRWVIEHQKLISQVDWVRVNDDIDKKISDFVGKHNHLQVIRSTNVKLAQSHLTLMFQKHGKVAPFFVNWSLYQNSPDFFIKSLKSRDIETLVISWDEDRPPQFCRYRDCRHHLCPGYDFRDFSDCIYILVNSKFQVPKNVANLEYFWSDLSQKTKHSALGKVVQFGGKSVRLESLISVSVSGGDVENFMLQNLDVNDISLLLENEDIAMCKPPSLVNDIGDNVVLKHPGWFVPRKLTQKYVDFSEDMLQRFPKDVFFVSSVELTYLHSLGIHNSLVEQWVGISTENPVRCYVLHPLPENKTMESVIQEISLNLSTVRMYNMLHCLKFRQGMFAYVKSVSVKNDNGGVQCHAMGLMSSKLVESLLEPSVFESIDSCLIADDPGTGKTTYLHFLAREMKDCHPEKWVSIIDLSLETNQKHLQANASRVSFSKTEVLDLLYEMVGCADSTLERTVFEAYSEAKSNIVVIFDAFDEICPKYKAVVTSLIKNLRGHNQNIKLFVSTRLHEKDDLEEALDVISFQLIPFSEDDQVTFLNKYWNQLLNSLPFLAWQVKLEKSIETFEKWVENDSDGEIKKLMCGMKEVLACSQKEQRLLKKRFKFTQVARRAVLCHKTSLHRLDRFTETPLHIQMAAALIFDDSFAMNLIMNLGHLYQRFFDLKMKIYGREKAGGSGNVQSEDFIRLGQERLAETMEEFALKLMLEKTSTEMDSDELRRVCNIGLVTRKGEEYQFIHRTFAEFFFARKMLKDAYKESIAKLWLNSLFISNHFERVVSFLEDTLRLFSVGFIDSKKVEVFLMFKKVHLNKLVISDQSTCSGLTSTLQNIIWHIAINTLQYFADSFGEIVARVLIGESECGLRRKPCGSAMEIAERLYGDEITDTLLFLKWNLERKYAQMNARLDAFPPPSTSCRHDLFLYEMRRNSQDEHALGKDDPLNLNICWW